MKIVFNGCNCGFGNNGGTQTNFRTANMLCNLGHEVEIWSSGPSMFTWFNLDPKIKYICKPDLNKLSCDVCIMCGFKSYKSVKNTNAKVKINWIRGWETWSNDEPRLIEICQDKEIINWVNSIWIQDYLKDYGIESKIMYPGIILQDYYGNLKERLPNKLTIGVLNSSQHNSPLKGFEKSIDILYKLKRSRDVNIIGYGNSPRHTTYNKYYQRPTVKQKREIYQECDIWLVTSVNEGLHIPPMEAVLCGCDVIIPENRKCGCYDWYDITERKGSTQNKYKSIDECVELLYKYKLPDKNYFNNLRYSISSNIGSVKDNVSKMIDLLKDYLNS